MKKVPFLLFLFLSIAGCKEKPVTEEKPITVEAESETGPNVECDKKIKKASEMLSPLCAENEIIKELLCLDYVKQIEWLKKNGDKICDNNLQECIEAFHIIEDEEVFNRMAMGNISNSTKIIFVEKTWGEIENVIKEVKCYEEYLTFDVSGNDIKLKLTTDFTTKGTCYSIPFLRGIQSRHKLGINDKFYFTKALIPVTMSGRATNEQKIIFKIQKGGADFYFYDLSDFPGFDKFIVPCGI
ncbi:hypothetical protein D3C87_298250 [compost metagenome]